MYSRAREMGREAAKEGLSFDPMRAQRELRNAPRWVDFNGKPFQTPALLAPSAEPIAKGGPYQGWNASPSGTQITLWQGNYMAV